MYGYIQICKPELKFREFDEYHAYYCGLCRSLKEHFGTSGQFLISYDFTFLTMLLDSLYEPESQTFDSHCIVHHMKKQHFIKSEATEYAADMCMLLAAYKLDDDWKDEKKLFKKIAAKLISRKTGRVKAAYIKKTEIIEKELTELSRLEQNNETNPEIVASCFGRVLAEILAYKDDVWEGTLRDIGFHMGKFIYLADAFDDLGRDKKKKLYNPFSSYDEHDPDFHTATEELLKMTIAPAAASFEYLPIIKNAEILRNILYAGVWTAFKKRKTLYLKVKRGE